VSPGRADPAIARRHLAALGVALEELRRHQARPLEDLLGSIEESWIVLHGLQLCAQNALDLAVHVAAGAGREPADYRSAVLALAELGALEPTFARAFADVAGFRNLLVHGYLDVDLARVHALLNERLDDFATFARALERWLDHEVGAA
jgi:uncharacterized protein YutE (UPF0331/DUF86 family)